MIILALAFVIQALSLFLFAMGYLLNEFRHEAYMDKWVTACAKEYQGGINELYMSDTMTMYPIWAKTQ